MAAAMLSACLSLGVPAHATVPTGNMTVARMFHQASPLSDGRVLITGGYAKPGTAPYASAEIYDPATGAFTPTAPMVQAREQHAAVTLQDGRVLVVGGNIFNSWTGTAAAEIYDPATGQWSAAGTMTQPRARVVARLLPDGKVFVVNKDDGASAEVYDPQTGIFTKTGYMVEQSGWHGVVVLPDGRVLKAGGYTASGYSRRAEIWDPASNQWSATGSMLETRQYIQPFVLPDGKVMVAGGRNGGDLRTTEIYDPGTGLFSAGAPMPEYLNVQSASTLPNGNVVLSGSSYKNLMQYQVATGTWNVTGPRPNTDREVSVTALPGGHLLLAGGAALNDATAAAVVWDHACAPQKIALTGATQTISGDGGPVGVTVAAAPGCRFEAKGMPAWLTIVGATTLEMPASGTLPVSFSAAVNSSTANRSATFMLGNTPVTLTQPPSPSCPSIPTVWPSSSALSYHAQGAVIEVSTVASCPWTIDALPSWASATSSTSGMGNGRVTYSVTANTGAARSGNGQLTALGGSRAFTISQDPVPLCPTALVLSPNSVTLPADGSSGTVNVSAAPTCPWTVGAVPSWMSVSGASGTGNGSFSYAAASNGGALRSAYVPVSGPGVGSSLSVSQTGTPCSSWSINPTHIAFAAGASSGSFTVTAAGSCNWTLAGLPGWIKATTSTSGVGNGNIAYTVEANSGAARSAVASLAGTGPSIAMNLSQAAAVIVNPCAKPIGSGVPVSGNLQPSTCGAGARGASYHTDRYTFTGAPGQRVTIYAASSSFDTYLYLRSPTGSVIASNDDGGGGTNSRIPAASGTYTLPAGASGTYTIEVSSYYAAGSGPYSLSLTQ